MRVLARLVLTLSAVGLLLAGVCAARPAWMAELKIDVWELPRLLERQNREAERRAALDATLASIEERVRVKDAVWAELIAGRLSLARAADRFTELARGCEPFWDHVHHNYPTASDREGVCRYLIDISRPTVAAAVLERLEEELAELFPGAAGVGVERW